MSGPLSAPARRVPSDQASAGGSAFLARVFPSLRKPYHDRKHYRTLRDQLEAAGRSTTLYVGNLSFYTSEEQVAALLGRTGTVKRVIMGLHREKRTPCGFCFVEYYRRQSAVDAERFLDGATLDGRILKLEMDPGFQEGRQYGRGQTGGQVRDEFRLNEDHARGGINPLVKSGLASPEQLMRQFATWPPGSRGGGMGGRLQVRGSRDGGRWRGGTSPRSRHNRGGGGRRGLHPRHHPYRRGDESSADKRGGWAKHSAHSDERKDSNGGGGDQRDERNPRFARDEDDSDGD